MIVISQNFVLSPDAEQNPNAPLIGADNIAAITNLVASSADADHPATNLANSATDLEWRASAIGEQTLTVTTGSADDQDYVGFATHNFGSASIAVSIEADDGGGYDEVLAPVIPPDDAPLILRFTAGPFVTIRARLAVGSAAPRAAVMHVGLLLAVQRLIGVGHMPITYAREPIIISPTSQNGKYLGSIETGLTNKNEIALRNLDPDWYRQELDPVIKARTPFFFAARPSDYPKEVGYVWATANAKPQNSRANGMMAITIPVEGEA